MKGFVFLILVAFAFLQAAHAQRGRNCNTNCSDIYDPMCVRGSRIPPTTVANDCQFAILKCDNPAEIFNIIKKGKC
ncbi:hypothetical protein J437_LFUL014833 [Ladona fulva]|uniref:Kazal-like domain-containing protein n=1 Tax=Ladona fulva TaxID=123851 RepID=A0A8K0KFM3_LADFU|nr:hypothetical protein J437_LFUL014833 [Ladona fulva]